MSGKLDQSLDEILKTSRRPVGRRGRGGRHASNTARNTTTAPVGGVKKNNVKQPIVKKASTPRVPRGPALANKESKVIISNFASDVNEDMIKDYCNQTIGPVKLVTITYGPNGVSRGIVTVKFAKAESAGICFNKMNDLVVDKRKLKVEIVVDAAAAEPLRSLNDRITNTKAQPKQAGAVKAAKDVKGGNNGTGEAVGRGGRGGRRGRRGGRAGGRPKPKTTQELDADMTDYFGANGENANGTNGEEAMDEVL